MLERFLFFFFGKRKEVKRNANSSFYYSRKAILEQLEDRQMLSVCPAQLPDLDVPVQTAIVSTINYHFDTSNALVKFDDAPKTPPQAQSTNQQIAPLTTPYNVWLGGGSIDAGAWQNASNWSWGTVPTAAETFVIDVGMSMTLEGDYTIDCSLIVLGNLTVTGNVTVMGHFQLVENASLTVTGDRASFSPTGQVTIDGGNISVLDGAFLDLKNLNSIDTGRFSILVGGTGSVLDLSQAFSLANGELQAVGGGTILNGNLFMLDQVALTLEGGSRFDADALGIVRNGVLRIAGGEWDFANLMMLDFTNVEIVDATARFPQVYAMTVSDNHLVATGGGSLLDLASLTVVGQTGEGGGLTVAAFGGGRVDMSSLGFLANANRVLLIASGEGSVLDLSTLDAATGPGRLEAHAADGGRVRLGTLANLENRFLFEEDFDYLHSLTAREIVDYIYQGLDESELLPDVSF